jgi:uncharacterized protein
MNRPVHFELLSENPEELAVFYRTVFGWEVATWEGPQSYWLVTTGTSDTMGIDGGFMHRHFEQPVINTIGVEDLEGMIRTVLEAGGNVIHGPHDVDGVGRHVYCTDPDGTLFGMMQFVSSVAA